MLSKKSLPLRVLLLGLVLGLLLTPLAVGAATPPTFVALGDSTGYGLSAIPPPGSPPEFYTSGFNPPLFGFNDQFALANGFVAGTTYFNYAYPGDKTGDLLTDLADATVQAKVRGARILTVNMGGNHLLGPAIAAIFGLWGIDPEDPKYEGDLDGSLMLADLAAAIALDPDPEATFMRLTDLTDPYALAFHKALLAGTADFVKQWPKACAMIRSLNRRGELYVNTLYNPIRVSGKTDPLYPVYVEFEALVGTINATIRSYALAYRYRVVDVYTAFRNWTEPVPVLTFHVPSAIQAARLGQVAEAILYADPHPTFVGHQVMFGLLTQVRAGTPSWYWWLFW